MTTIEPASDEDIAEIEGYLRAGWLARAGTCAEALIARIRQQNETIKRMDEALAWYANQLCEGIECGCGHMDWGDCAGCRAFAARAALKGDNND